MKTKKRIYLDNAATTAIRPEVIDEMAQTMKSYFGNPSSIHADGRNARSVLENARKKVAYNIGASIGEVFFTSGGTESNNMALKCAVRDLGVRRIISSPIEHHCVLHTLDRLRQTDEIECILLDVDAKGQVDLSQLQQLLADDRLPTLVSLMHSNNEIGTLNDIEEIAEICARYSAYFHTDSVQTMGYYSFDLSGMTHPIHFLTGSGHKFHGPKGVGFIYVNNDISIHPLIDGGSQERNMRAGTENIYGIVGLAKALDIAYQELDDNRHHIENLRNYLMDQLTTIFEDIEFNGAPCCHYKVLSVSFPSSEKSELLLLNLDIAGISASGGSACSSGAEIGSHVLNALAVDPSRKTIRFSFSHHNTIEELDQLMIALKGIYKKQLVSS